MTNESLIKVYHPLTQSLCQKGIHYQDTSFAGSIDWLIVNKLILEYLEGVMERKGKYFTEYQGLREILSLPQKPDLESELADKLDRYCHEQYKGVSINCPDVAGMILEFLKNKGALKE